MSTSSIMALAPPTEEVASAADWTLDDLDGRHARVVVSSSRLGGSVAILGEGADPIPGMVNYRTSEVRLLLEIPGGLEQLHDVKRIFGGTIER